MRGRGEVSRCRGGSVGPDKTILARERPLPLGFGVKPWKFGTGDAKSASFISLMTDAASMLFIRVKIKRRGCFGGISPAARHPVLGMLCHHHPHLSPSLSPDTGAKRPKKGRIKEKPQILGVQGPQRQAPTAAAAMGAGSVPGGERRVFREL